MGTTNNSMPVKTSDSAIWGSNVFGGTRVEAANSATKLKLKATDKLINFNEFGYIAEDAPLTRDINPKVVEVSTLKDVDFSDCRTLTELCEKALKELVQDGADSNLAEVAVAGFIMWWGRNHYGLTPVVNFVNGIYESVMIKVAEFKMNKKRQGLDTDFTTFDIQNSFEYALASIISAGDLEEEVNNIKSHFRANLKRKIAKLNNIELDYIIKDVTDCL